MMVEWILRLPYNPATGAGSAEGALRFLPGFSVICNGVKSQKTFKSIEKQLRSGL